MTRRALEHSGPVCPRVFASVGQGVLAREVVCPEVRFLPKRFIWHFSVQPRERHGSSIGGGNKTAERLE